jgi:hypothetical protein
VSGVAARVQLAHVLHVRVGESVGARVVMQPRGELDQARAVAYERAPAILGWDEIR